MSERESPEKQLLQAGRKTRDALRIIRDLVRRERKADLYNPLFAELDGAVEEATDGLIEISEVFGDVIRKDVTTSPAVTDGDVQNLHTLQSSLAEMKMEREELIDNLQVAQQQLQKYADDLQILYTKEREKRAELAEAYERLQEADRLKSDFLSTINHELSSPLVPVDLSIQLVEKGPLNDDQRRSLLDAKKYITQYKRQLDGIIKYASLVSKTHVLVPQAVDAEQFLRNTLEPLQMLARGRGIELHIEPVPDAVNLTADPDLLGQALYQVVHNAIKFNKQGGRVDIKIYNELGHVVFHVQDDGVGIPAEIIERLGQDFNQIVDAVKRGIEGLGLGLALAHYVTSVHNGQLTAQHAEKTGTIVQLRIPHIGEL